MGASLLGAIQGPVLPTEPTVKTRDIQLVDRPVRPDSSAGGSLSPGGRLGEGGRSAHMICLRQQFFIGYWPDTLLKKVKLRT